MTKDKLIKVIALGGSLVNPGKPDVLFLKKFKTLILSLLKKNYKFLFVVGGGKICRIFQKSLKQLLPDITNERLDWLGIKVTHLNAAFVANIFSNVANQNILKSFSQKIVFDSKIVVGGGVKPGRSTDYNAFYWGKKIGIKKIYIPTNVKYIFDKDPKKFTSAKPFKKITWRQYIDLIADKWSPGLNIPIDHKAAYFGKRYKMMAYVFNGKDLKNFKKALTGSEFIGTIVTP